MAKSSFKDEASFAFVSQVEPKNIEEALAMKTRS